ncbi:MFS transporter [Actinokineospora spheciospongiae]|uniref:MFS transporter n=1 Tax=Actinokineospora spheciospongiae TaxID=909613 RepID=UPI00068D7158|nr:MFS transporter [Actinokineospora spheciospongiae]
MRNGLAWPVALGAAGLVFDGYDLVVYGALVPLFLRSPGEIGALTPAAAGALGSYALIGVLVGALAAGAVSDRWGRRPVLLGGYAWFSVGMGATALTSSTQAFGAWRLVTGIGIGVVVATTGVLVSELAPPGRGQLCTTVAYCGIPLGSVLGTVAALSLLDTIGWRGLFWIGALPLVVLLPLAWWRLPESPAWRGRERGRSGFAGLFTGPTLLPAVLLGVVSGIGLLLVFALSTWLPELMGRSGFGSRGSLVLLLVLNGGAVVGALLASPLAERFGPRRVVAGCFGLGGAGMLLIGSQPPAAVVPVLVAVVGLGTTGTQILVIGLATATFPTAVRGAGVAWCTGFGRLGGIAGPLVVGLLVAAGSGVESLFTALGVVAALGAGLALLVRSGRAAPRTPSPGPARHT